MSKIAIDVVLLPDEKMVRKAVEISKAQAQQFGDKILLDETNCLPHISLAMGVIEKSQLQELKQILNKIADKFGKLDLVADEYNPARIHTGDIISEFTVETTGDLQSLHEVVLENFKPFLSHDASADMCFSPPPVEEITTYWINKYPDSSFDKFKPHITLGFGSIDYKDVPIKFSASKLAICHLGNYCTCRKILALRDL